MHSSVMNTGGCHRSRFGSKRTSANVGDKSACAREYIHTDSHRLTYTALQMFGAQIAK